MVIFHELTIWLLFRTPFGLIYVVANNGMSAFSFDIGKVSTTVFLIAADCSLVFISTSEGADAPDVVCHPPISNCSCMRTLCLDDIFHEIQLFKSHFS